MNSSKPQMPPIQGPQIKINPATLPELLCTCGCNTFAPAMQFRKMSAIVSPTGQEQWIPIQTIACVKCPEIPEDFKLKATDVVGK